MPDQPVSITIKGDAVQLLSEAFSNTEQIKQADLCKAIAQLAVDEWLNWLSGERRFLSLTEQHIERVSCMYERLLPGDRPTPSEISYRFKLPEGQAAYISRVLSDRKFTKWRALGLAELKRLLNSRASDAAQRLKDREGEKKVSLKMSKMAVRELERCYNDCLKSDGNLSPASPNGRSIGDRVEIELQWLTVAALLKHTDLKS